MKTAAKLNDQCLKSAVTEGSSIPKQGKIYVPQNMTRILNERGTGFGVSFHENTIKYTGKAWLHNLSTHPESSL